nr:unnamed protein product [Digitaria exilis]
MAEAAVVAAATIFFFLSTTALPAVAATVEHTFVVSQMTMTHLCKKTPVTVVNGQLPGPTIEVTEGDSVIVHVVNKSPHNITIHWHGVRQLQNGWNDGVPMVTQCPIQPNQNFTYRFNVAGQVGTLWWHAHVSCLRGTLHGAIVIRPRDGTNSYPFPKPDREVPVVIGVHEDSFMLDVEPGKTYLLRIINAGLFSEYFFKVAGHRFTVVGSDANYVTPFTTDLIVIVPGETVDALLVADARPGKYYMVALPNQAPLPDTQTPEPATRGIVRYTTSGHHHHRLGNAGNTGKPAAALPVMPNQHDVAQSLYFHSNLSSLQHPHHPVPQVPKRVDEHMFVTLGLGTACRHGGFKCNWDVESETGLVATMNNISFMVPTAPLLPEHYRHVGSQLSTLVELPDKPPMVFNFTDVSLIPVGPKEKKLETTYKATLARWFRYGSAVEIVFQSTAMLQGDSNPMHLHGHDMFVLAQGAGNYDEARDVPKYNLVNPPRKNTVVVPNLGWVAVRFVADNPGVWYMHCHYEFHLAMGMTAVFIVEDGPTANTSLPPPPVGFPTCSNNEYLVPREVSLQTPQHTVSRLMD